MKFALDFGGSTIDIHYIKDTIKEFHSLESKLFNKNIKNFIEQSEKAKLIRILEAFKIFSFLSSTEVHVLCITGGFSHTMKHSPHADIHITLAGYRFSLCIISEFSAIGKGAAVASRYTSGIAVSLGTGTAMVLFNADAETYTHIKGTGLGGGTFIGLGKALLGISDFNEISLLAQKGKKEKIDLSIGEITGGDIDLLPASATASNFAKYTHTTSHADIALGISTLIAESITALAIEKCLRYKQTSIVFGGKFSKLSILRTHVEATTKLFNIRAIFPEHSEYITVIGAYAHS